MKKIIAAVAAVVIIASCTKTTKTIIKGHYLNPDNVSETVHVWFDDTSDTTITVDPVSASFKFELPKNLLSVCSLQTGLFDSDGAPQEIAFISEGGTLTFEIDADNIDVKATVKDSPTLSLVDFSEKNDLLLEQYTADLNAILKDTTIDRDARAAAIEALDDELSDKMNALNLEIAAKNRDNIIAPLAISSADLEDEQLYEELMQLDPSVRAVPIVAEMIEPVEARLKAVGMPFIDFTIVQDPDDPEGSTVSLSDYVGKGKYILLDFWASWCKPCRKEIPNIRNVWEKYSGENFDVVSVAVWDKPAATKAAIEELGMEWNNIINAGSTPADLYGIEGIPHIILFAPDGTVVKRGLRGSAIEKAVSACLKN